MENIDNKTQVNVEQTVKTYATAKDFLKRRKEREKVEEITLPSGMLVKVQRPNIFKLIGNGVIPADVAVSVQEMQSVSNGQKVSGKMMTDYIKLLDVYCEAVFVSPKVKQGEVTDEEYENNTISVDDIEQQDKEAIFGYVEFGTTDLDSFRQ